MRNAWLPLLAALVPLAGCLNDSAGSGDGGLPDPLEYAVPAIPAVDAAALLADHAAFVTEHNERADNLPTHESARQALLGHFDSYGLETYRHNFTAGGLDQANIVGIRWGVDRDHWVVVGGHYDTITDDCVALSIAGGGDLPCPLRSLSQGAYDDGSGTLIAVHLAKAFSTVTPYYTIAFVAYDGEERGLEGAGAFVNDFHVEGTTPYGQIQIVGDIDLDMIGLNWPGVMAPVNVLTNSDAAFAVADAKRQEMGWPDGQWLRKDGLQLGSSDYARFWSVSEPAPIPTIFFISNFEEIGAPAPAPDAAHTPTSPVPRVPLGVYPFWHLEDTVETMTLMAGGPANLEAGFQSISDVAAAVLHAMSCQPLLEFDATPR